MVDTKRCEPDKVVNTAPMQGILDSINATFTRIAEHSKPLAQVYLETVAPIYRKATGGISPSLTEDGKLK